MTYYNMIFPNSDQHQTPFIDKINKYLHQGTHELVNNRKIRVQTSSKRSSYGQLSSIFLNINN